MSAKMMGSPAVSLMHAGGLVVMCGESPAPRPTASLRPDKRRMHIGMAVAAGTFWSVFPGGYLESTHTAGSCTTQDKTK